MKMTILTILILLISLPALAPDERKIVIADIEPINPYETILRAIVAVESAGNTFAYNEKEGAAGAFQIRICRLDDYNMRTGKNYTPADRFNYEISREIFLWYASKYRPDDVLGIARCWNGASKYNKYYHKIIAKL